MKEIVKDLYPRFNAWWHGADLPGDESEPGKRLNRAQFHSSTPTTLRIPPGMNRWGKALWTAKRLEVTEKLWGEGSILPLTGKNFLHYLAPLGLNPSKTVLEIGAGLGSFGQLIVENYGAYYTGLEESKHLLFEGARRATEKGLSKKLEMTAFDRENFEYSKRRVDVVLIRETAYTISNMLGCVKSIGKCLKENGQLMIIDFFMTDDATENNALDMWQKKEPIEPQITYIGQLTQMLEENGFYVNICENITEIYFASIYKCFWGFQDFLQSVKMDEETKANVLDEAELWACREAALRHGLLVYRVTATKAKETTT